MEEETGRPGRAAGRPRATSGDGSPARRPRSRPESPSGDAPTLPGDDLAGIAEAEALAEAEVLAAEGVPTEPVEFDAGLALPILDDARSPNPAVCPFLRSIEGEDRLVAPIEAPDARNRCAAFGEPREQSMRQQALVCLQTAHVDCPRYLRGALVARDPAAADRARGSVTRATLAATLILVASAAASFAFVVARNGLALPELAAGSPGPAASEAAVASPVATVPPSFTPTAAPTPGPTVVPTAELTPSPSPEPTPSPTPEPTASPAPTSAPTATPKPTSNRYALLDPCPNKPNCYIYTVRAGDNLYSIAHYFGVSQDSIYRLNPWTKTTPLRAGQQLILPPPTR